MTTLWAVQRDGTRIPINSTINESMINDSLKSKSMINDINDDKERTEKIADDLVEEFNAPESRDFFLKVAWHLPTTFIWDKVKVSRSKRISSPLHYFVKICKNEMMR